MVAERGRRLAIVLADSLQRVSEQRADEGAVGSRRAT